MKKLLLLSLVTVLAVSLVGCGENNNVEGGNQDNVIVSGDNNLENNEENNEEFVSGEEEIENPEEPIVVPELEAKINTLMEKSGVMIRMPMASPIEAFSAFTFIGLTEDEFNANVATATAFESMIMPANQSVCLVELKDTADVASVKQKMIDNCDPNKWICMSADKCMVVDSGKYVLLVMSTQEDCEALKTAFADEFGNVGEALTK